MPEDFKVRVGQFDGPLELLLDLVEKRKLHISEVTLSKVADEFMEHVKSFDEFPVADSALNSFPNESSGQKHKYVSDIADFILVASTLLLIKSKSLLPGLPLSEEEEVSIEDLENRLATYKKYKGLSLELQKMFGNFLYFAKEKKRMEILFSPTSEITLSSLKDSLAEAMKNMPKREKEMPKVSVGSVISLEEMIERLSERIEKNLRTSFSDFTRSGSQGQPNKVEKVEIIVSFLAMLELVKQGIVRVSQGDHFDDIQIESERVSVPSY